MLLPIDRKITMRRRWSPSGIEPFDEWPHQWPSRSTHRRPEPSAVPIPRDCTSDSRDISAARTAIQSSGRTVIPEGTTNRSIVLPTLLNPKPLQEAVTRNDSSRSLPFGLLERRRRSCERIGVAAAPDRGSSCERFRSTGPVTRSRTAVYGPVARTHLRPSQRTGRSR